MFISINTNYCNFYINFNNLNPNIEYILNSHYQCNNYLLQRGRISIYYDKNRLTCGKWLIFLITMYT